MFVSLASSAEAVARPSLVLCGDARHSWRTSGCGRSLGSAYAFRILEAFNLAGVALEQRRRLANAHADEVAALLANLSTLTSSPSAANPVSSKNSRTLLQTALTVVLLAFWNRPGSRPIHAVGAASTNLARAGKDILRELFDLLIWRKCV